MWLQTIKKLKIISRIFQGDSLSPLLFCLALFPWLAASNKGNQNSKHEINDLKIFGKNYSELPELLNVVHNICEEVCNLDCKNVHIKRKNETQELISARHKHIKYLQKGELYKCLGIEGSRETEHNYIKSKLSQEHYRRVK